jgi:RNA polymerase sigma-70 factor (ECF subfamily)
VTGKTLRDRRALDRALRDGLPAVLDVMRLRGVPQDDREDAAQKALIRAFESIDSYDAERPFLPWLKTIAFRTASDHLRQLRTQRGREQLAGEERPDPMDPRAPNEEQMIRRYDAPRLLDECLAALSDERREVFVMGEIEDFSTEQIADVTGTNVNTVRSRLARAREDFEAVLKRRWIAEETRTGAAVVALPGFFFSAAALIDAGRTSPTPPDVLARVWIRVARAIGSSLPAASGPDDPARGGAAAPPPPGAHGPSIAPGATASAALGPRIAASLGGGASVKATLAASAAVFGLVVGGGLLWLRLTAPDRAALPIVHDAAQASAALAPVTSSAPAPTTTAPAPVPPALSSSPPRVDPATLERQESALLDKAQALFASGKTKEGCDALRTLAARFPRGVYQEQRKVLWSAAKCGEAKP